MVNFEIDFINKKTTRTSAFIYIIFILRNGKRPESLDEMFYYFIFEFAHFLY